MTNCILILRDVCRFVPASTALMFLCYLGMIYVVWWFGSFERRYADAADEQRCGDDECTCRERNKR